MRIRKILESKGEHKVSCRGWIKTHQVHGNISFLHINDGSTFQNLQVVYKKPIGNIEIGSSVSISGELKKSQGTQEWEVLAEEITILAKATDFPIQKKEHSFEYLREITHLRHRTAIFTAVNNIKNEAFHAIHSFFYNEGFIWIQAPIITGNNCEGGAEVFEIHESNKFFKKPALLSVSGQFHAEALAQGLGKIYTFGPTFRSEKSNSSNHLAEFWMIEPEMAFFKLQDNIQLIERFIKSVVDAVLKKCRTELSFLQEKLPDNSGLIDKLENLVNNKFEILEYRKAVELLNLEFGTDLNSEQERAITAKFNKPVFVINYPKKIKAFYMKDHDQDTVSSLDLLVPGIGELIGGSQRESSLEKLKQKAMNLNISTENLNWYLELRKYGYYASSGFGCGYERLILYLTGLKNIKDAITYPRSYGNLNF